MAALILLLLGSWPVTYAKAIVDRLHTYDVLRYDVVAVPGRDALAVDCTVRVKIRRPGPLRFFIGRVEGLEAEGRAKASVGTGGFEQVARLVAPDVAVPSLLTVTLTPPPAVGDEVAFRLRYDWRPAPGTAAYVKNGRVETHLWPFWLPTMADERFDAAVTVKTTLPALGVGARARTEEGWTFTAKNAQLVSLFVAPFETTRRGRFELALPPGATVDAEQALADLADVHERLTAAFGALRPGPVTLVVDPRTPPVPSYCADDFFVIHHDVQPSGRGRPNWLALLAHECSHRWWGHHVGSTVLGGGGTFLREGLAQWSGARFAGDADLARRLFRGNVRLYLGRADIRHDQGRLFANETTLEDATYIDPPGVPYFRGALVFRMLEHRLGPDAFRAMLAKFAAAHGGRFATLADLEAACGQPSLFAYYVRRTALPDFALRDVAAGRGRVVCADPAWPAGPVPVKIGDEVVDVLVRSGEGRFTFEGRPERIEIDPERIYLDPIQKNNVWTR